MTSISSTDLPAAPKESGERRKFTETTVATRPALLYVAAAVLTAAAARALLPENPSFVSAWLVQGAIGGSIWSAAAFALSRLWKEAAGRWLLAIILVGAAANYIYFATQAGAPNSWVAGELLGVAIFGAMGVQGLRGSPRWLAAGWALHPLWDVALHYVGPGTSFAPAAYAISCISFDLVVAGYVTIAYRRPGRRIATT